MGTYSFLNFVATLSGPGGSIDLSAEAGEHGAEGVGIEPTEDKNSMTTGAGGAVMHSLRASKSGMITVTLMKTSPVNAKLMNMYNLQTNNPSLHGQNVLVMRDRTRGDQYTNTQVAFKRLPGNSYAIEGGSIVWQFDAGVIDPQLGSGTPSLTGSLGIGLNLNL